MTNPKTLARTNNPQESKDAAKRMVDSGKLSWQEEMVYIEIERYSRLHKDFTTKDIARYWWPSNGYEICRRRFSGLFNKFKICLTGDRREGCRVWRLL